MKFKLIACLLGISIILTSGTTVLAEADLDASAGSAVADTQILQSEPAPAAEPAT